MAKRMCALGIGLLLVIGGCGLGNPSNNDDGDGAPRVVAGLKQFESEAEFVAYFQDQVEARSEAYEEGLWSRGGGVGADLEGGAVDATDGDAPPADPIANDDGAGAPGGQDNSGGTSGEDDGVSHSDTTTQEEGVDEADVVKTDGEYAYLLSDGHLRIARIYPPTEMAELSTLPLAGYPRDMYLVGDRAVVLTEEYFYYYGGGIAVDVDMDVAVDSDDAQVIMEDSDGEVTKPAKQAVNGSSDEEIMPAWEGPQLRISVIDISDRSAPQLLSTTAFEGSLADSRMIDGRLHAVLAKYPEVYLGYWPRFGTPELDVQEIDSSEMIPSFSVTDADGAVVSSGSVVSWQEVYRPEEADGFGMTFVVSMDVTDAATSFAAIGLVAEPGLIYSSTESLYLSNSQWSFDGDIRTTTNLYKLTYTDDGAIPVAGGTVPGRLLNQYSLGEYGEHLRVATTVDAAFFEDGTRTEPYNNVYVLGVDGEDLTITGRIEDIAPGETIQSARFLGDRGFVVTFRQIDPLFTLDLADPTSPEIVGELKIPGFSTFLMPLDENHLLGLGEYVPEDAGWPRRVQLSIFDITDFSQPVQAHNIIIGEEDEESWSMATWDPKAFTYFAEGGYVALPVSIYDTYAWWEDVDGIAVDDLPDAPADDEMVDPDPADDGEMVDPELEGDDKPDEDGDDPAEGDIEEPGDIIEEPIYYERDWFEGVIVFSVSPTQGFTEVGRLDTDFSTEEYWTYIQYARAIFVEDDVFAVTDRGIRGGPVANLSNQPYELVFDILDYPDRGNSDEGIAVPETPPSSGSDGDADSGSGGAESEGSPR